MDMAQQSVVGSPKTTLAVLLCNAAHKTDDAGRSLMVHLHLFPKLGRILNDGVVWHSSTLRPNAAQTMTKLLVLR